MSGHVFWRGNRIRFQSGEMLASALMRAGVANFGIAPSGQVRALFCGIGQCQGCMVRADGVLTEACLLPCREGLSVTQDAGGHDE